MSKAKQIKKNPMSAHQLKAMTNKLKERIDKETLPKITPLDLLIKKLEKPGSKAKTESE
jgi:hypothetical protein